MSADPSKKCTITNCAVCAWGKAQKHMCGSKKCKETFERLFSAMHWFETVLGMEAYNFHEELQLIAKGKAPR